jgi:hypothetical protein
LPLRSLPDDALPAIMQAVSLETMRDEGLRAENAGLKKQSVWREGAKTFFNKGVNGRWKNVLSA